MISKYIAPFRLEMSLVFMIAASWFLFPVMLKLLAPSAIRVVFMLVLMAVVLLHFLYGSTNGNSVDKLTRKALYAWGGYLACLSIATLLSQNGYSLKHLFIVLLKVGTFLFLIRYLTLNVIKTSLKVYSYMMMAVVVLAIIVGIGVAMEIMEPVYTLRNETDFTLKHPFDIYWGAYYGLTALNFPFPLFRLQGLCEEPGTFAFVLLPALIYFLYVENDFVKASVIGAGLLWCFPLGVFIGFPFLIFFIWAINPVSDKQLKFLSVLLLIFVVLFFSPPIDMILSSINTLLLSMDINNGSGMLSGIIEHTGRPSWLNEYAISKFYGEYSGTNDRLEGIIISLNHLMSHPLGTGAALGMPTVNFSISNGYANAALEAGFLGGAFYIVLFSIFVVMAVKTVLAYREKDNFNLALVSSISVMCIVFMGLQRQQPDQSFWHMWILASMVFLYVRRPKKPGERTESSSF